MSLAFRIKLLRGVRISLKLGGSLLPRGLEEVAR